jgi:hypothetical protein
VTGIGNEARGEIVIYEAGDGGAALEVKLSDNTAWLTQQQMVQLFERDQSVVSRHINNVFKEGELSPESNMQKMHIANSDKPTVLYSLDVVISVGYRVKSRRGTDFRIWATNVLRDHIVKGYTINQRRLWEQTERYQELQEAVALIGETLQKRELDGSQAEGLLHVITDYAYALSLLDDYDHQRLAVSNTSEHEVFRITYEAARDAIDRMADRMRSDGMSVGLYPSPAAQIS